MNENFNNKFFSFFILLFLLNFLCFAGCLLVFSGTNYSIDSYSVYLTSIEKLVDFTISSYRFIAALIFYLINFVHNPIENATIDVIIFSLSCSFTISSLTCIFYSVIKDNDILTLVCLNFGLAISFINVWFLDYLSYPEAIFPHAISIVFMCFSVILVKCWLTKRKKIINCLYLIASTVCLVFSTGVSQQLLPLFGVFALMLCILDYYHQTNKDSLGVKEVTLRYFPIVAVFVCSGLAYYAIASLIVSLCKLSDNPRASFSIHECIQRVLYFVNMQHSFIKGRGFFESEVYSLLIMCSLLLWGIAGIVNLKTYKSVSKLVIIGFISLYTYCLAYLPGILSTSHATRTLYVIHSIFFVILIGILCFNGKLWIKYTYAGILFCVLLINVIRAVECECNLKRTNSIDIQHAEQIVNAIRKYEQKMNIKVTTIAFCEDQKPTRKYFSHSYSDSAFAYSYSRIALLKYVDKSKIITNIEFVKIPTNVYETYFYGKDWSIFDLEEQVVFDGNAVYICNY